MPISGGTVSPRERRERPLKCVCAKDIRCKMPLTRPAKELHQSSERNLLLWLSFEESPFCSPLVSLLVFIRSNLFKTATLLSDSIRSVLPSSNPENYVEGFGLVTQGHMDKTTTLQSV